MTAGRSAVAPSLDESPGGTLRVLRVGGAPRTEYALTTPGDEPPAVPADPPVDDLPGGQDLQAEQGGLSGLPEANVSDPQPGAEPEPHAGQPGPARPLPVDLLYTTSFGKVYHRRSTCGKLKCATRIYRHPACVDCPRWSPGVVVGIYGGSYHTVNHDGRPTTWKACSECGD